MHIFCTLFDSNYLSRGLAMYHSLSRYMESFHLYVFAFDDASERILNEQNFSNVTVIPLAQFEDEELLKVKDSRSVAEYCWTCTSSTILYVLNNYQVAECTYLDADLYFFASPQPLFDELGNRSILLTEHRFSPIYHRDIENGRFCVQFITFRNNAQGRLALTWWREQCLRWCYARNENGQFGDQGYLNDWETRFEGVHVLQHLGGGVAPWNVQQYPLFAEGEKVYGNFMDQDFELIFYHFHYLKYFTDGTIELGRRHFTANDFRLIYVPYLLELDQIRKSLEEKYPGLDSHGTRQKTFLWKTPLIFLYRKLRGVYHIYDKNEFLQRFNAGRLHQAENNL